MIEEIKALKELLDMGAITQEEFDGKKRELLDLKTAHASSPAASETSSEDTARPKRGNLFSTGLKSPETSLPSCGTRAKWIGNPLLYGRIAASALLLVAALLSPGAFIPAFLACIVLVWAVPFAWVKAQAMQDEEKRRQRKILLFGGACVLFVAMLLLSLALFSSGGHLGESRVYYEDERFAVSGFEIKQEAEGLYNAVGTVKAKNGAYTEGLMSSVVLRDKDGGRIAETVGFSNEVPRNGSAVFYVALFDGSDFLSQEQVDSIASYEISDLSTYEGLQNAVERKSREAKEAQDALKRKYPNENL